jgi:hypothetical protein
VNPGDAQLGAVQRADEPARDDLKFAEEVRRQRRPQTGQHQFRPAPRAAVGKRKKVIHSPLLLALFLLVRGRRLGRRARIRIGPLEPKHQLDQLLFRQVLEITSVHRAMDSEIAPVTRGWVIALPFGVYERRFLASAQRRFFDGGEPFSAEAFAGTLTDLYMPKKKK